MLPYLSPCSWLTLRRELGDLYNGNRSSYCISGKGPLLVESTWFKAGSEPCESQLRPKSDPQQGPIRVDSGSANTGS